MRGRKPKTYAPDLIARVTSLYEAGSTQAEVAAAVGTTQKVVWRLMIRHGIGRRPQAKRDQRGVRNVAWKGDAAGYAALHLRVATARGTPSACADCGTTTAKRYEWASISRDYANIADYKRLCASCHRRFDGVVANLRGGREHD